MSKNQKFESLSKKFEAKKSSNANGTGDKDMGTPKKSLFSSPVKSPNKEKGMPYE